MVNGLPYIPNKRLFQAVSFSLTMQRNGVHPDLADRKTAEYYGCLTPMVASYTEAAPPWMRRKGEPPADGGICLKCRWEKRSRGSEEHE